jgi:hypothetical protein
MFEYCKPGEKVLRSGIYRVTHGPECGAEHEVTCVLGKFFPRCNTCGEELNFSLVRYAPDAETHQFFRLDGQPAPLGSSDAKARNHRNVWTEAEIARLKTLLVEGRSLLEVAQELGRSEGAVRMRATAAGLLAPPN